MEETPQSQLARESRPHIPGWTLGVVCTGLVFGAFVTVGAAAQVINPAFGLWFSEIFVFVGVPFVILRYAGRQPLKFARVGKLTVKQAVLGFLFGLTNFFAVVLPIQYVATQIFPESWRERFDVSQIFERQSGPELALLIASVVIAAPLGEEFFFRGVLLRATAATARKAMGPLLLSAAVFSAFHMDPVGFLGRMELGILFGWLFLRGGSFWPSVFAHAANNAVATVLYFVGKAYAPSVPEEPPELSQVLVLTAMGLAFFLPLVGAIRRNPQLLGPGAVAEPEPEREPSPSLAALALPWILSAALAVVALVGIDRRGVELNVIDLRNPLPNNRASADSVRESLEVLRKEVRRGEQPIEVYEERRETASQAAKDRSER